jgi:hypothetical protein
MAEEPVATPNAGGQPSAAPSAAPHPEVRDRLTPELESELEYYRQLSARMTPFAEIIDPILDDENARGAAAAAIKAAKAYKEQDEPEVPKWAKQIQEDVKAVKTRSDEAVQAYELQSAKSYVENLGEKYEFLKANNWSMVNDLETEAKSFGIKAPRDIALYIEKVAKRTGVNTKAEPEPPTSLRADAGEPGIPGEREPQPKDPQQIRDTLIKRARAASR